MHACQRSPSLLMATLRLRSRNKRGCRRRCDQARPERRIDQQQEKGPVCESSERPHDLRGYSLSKEGVQITSQAILENPTDTE